MSVKYKEILPVLFWVGISVLPRVSCSGWKPIPPPRGLYVPKTPHSIRGGPEHEHTFKHPLLDDFPGIEALKSSLADQIDGLPDDDFHKHIGHSHKYNLEDIFSKPTGDDGFFQREPVKAFKPSVQTYEEISKRPPVSFHNYNAFRTKPGKTLYFEKPEELKPAFKDEIKYIKPFKSSLYDDYKYYKGPSDNEIKPYYPFKGGSDEQCTLYKVAFRQDLYFQYIQYKVNVPDLKEFTLCMWNKFHNHSNDHPLFSYAVRHQPKAIYMWVSNTERSNYYNMKVNGHTIFRLNYPIRLNKWYHTCTSWNGKTGEWQVWVNAERIGRGFHNLLVGHVIPGNGLAISGQEQRQFGGGFLEGPGAPKGSGGFLGEITMVQLYKIALTAGKAYNDHRHHHSLHASTTPEPPPLPSEDPPVTPAHPFLENGQLRQPLKVFELAEALRTKGNLDVPDTQPSLPGIDFFNSHLGHNYYGSIDSSAMVPFSLHGNGINLIPLSDHSIYKRNDGNERKSDKNKGVDPRSKRNGDKAQGNHGANRDVEKDETEKPEKVKFIANPPAQVHVEKIKYSAKKRSQEKKESEEDLHERRKRDVNGTRDETEDESGRGFVTVDEGKTEPDDEGRGGRALEFRRKRPARHNQHSLGIRRLPSTRPKRVSQEMMIPRHKVNFRPKEDAEKQINRKEAEGSDEEEEKDPAKRQILLGDPSLGLGALNLFGSEYGPIFGQMPVLGIPLHPATGPEYPQQEEGPLNVPQEQEEEQEHEEEDSGPSQPEPAEGEVRRIMGICSGCELDPFRKVAVISWRSTPKKIYSGALFLKARPECRKF